MRTDSEVRARAVQANGAELHCETRGSGDAVVLIPGPGGDGGTFDGLARALADRFTVVTYDRRGCSRSPRPAGWKKTSIEEQAGDAAGLIDALGVAPAGVFGSSTGAAIALELILRNPGLVRGAVLHEPFIPKLLGPQLPTVMDGVESAIEPAMKAGGPAAAIAAFMGPHVGFDGWGGLDRELRQRLEGNAQTLFEIEFPAVLAYHPAESALESVVAPLILLLQEDSGFAPIRVVCDRLAEHTKCDIRWLPGTHVGYVQHADRLAPGVQALLEEVLSR